MIKSRLSIPAPKKARGAKEMADSDKIPQIDPTEIEILIEKLEQNKLEERETIDRGSVKDLPVYSRAVAGKEDHAAQDQGYDLRTEERKE
jgi:hypothetical protein